MDCLSSRYYQAYSHLHLALKFPLHAIVLEIALKLIIKMKVGDVEIKNEKRTQRVIGEMALCWKGRGIYVCCLHYCLDRCY